MTTLVERYALGPAVGHSAGSTVHVATDRTLHRPVAVTVVPPSSRARADATVARAHTAAALSHPNLLTVLDAGDSPDGAFVVTERIEGATLVDRLRDGPLDQRELATMLDAVLAAVEGLHHHGLLVGGFASWQVRYGVDGMWSLAVLPASDTDATPLPLGGPIPERDADHPGAAMSPSDTAQGRADDLVAVGVLAVASLAGRPWLRGVQEAQTALSTVDDDAGLSELVAGALAAGGGEGAVTAAALRQRLPGGAPAGLPATLGLPAPATTSHVTRSPHPASGRLRRLARVLGTAGRR